MPERTGPHPTPGRAISRFRQQFKRLADPDRAEQEKRYLNSPFEFYGISKQTLWHLSWSFRQGGFHQERALAMLRVPGPAGCPATRLTISIVCALIGRPA